MSSSLAAFANRLYNHVAGPSSQPSEQPIVVTDEGEEQADDLAAENYISPQNRSRAQQRHQRRTDQEGIITSRHFQSHAMQRSNGSERTERQRQLLPPRAGDRFGSAGTPLQHPSLRMSSRGLNGAVRPRNDFSSQNGTMSRNTAQSRIGANSDEPAAKRRKTIAAEGDGFEQEPIVKAPARQVRAQKTESTIRPARNHVDLHRIRKQHYERTERFAADTAKKEWITTNGLARHNADETSRPLAQSSDQEPHVSSRSSPDPLAEANGPGPDGVYKTVALARNPSPTANPRRPPYEREPLSVGSGFELSRVRYGKNSNTTGPRLELVPQRDGSSFTITKNGESIGLMLETKEVEHLISHINSPVVIAKYPSDSTAEQISLQFAAMKDWSAFLKQVVPSLGGKHRIVKNRDILMREAFGTPTPIGSADGSDDSLEAAKISVGDPGFVRQRHGRLSGPGQSMNHHTSQTIDTTLRAGRESIGHAPLARRSTRSTRNSSNSFADLAHHHTSDEVHAAPEVQKYSVVHGLPDRWKHHLTYPTFGKNRATVYWDDLYKLDEGELLNDNLINFHIRFQEEKLSKEKPEVAQRVYWFNTYFFTTLVSGRRTIKNINYAAVQKWTRNVDIFGYDYIVVPIVENFHWYVAIICNVSQINQTATQSKQSMSSETGEQKTTASKSTPMQETLEPVDDARDENPENGERVLETTMPPKSLLPSLPMDMNVEPTGIVSIHPETAPLHVARQRSLGEGDKLDRDVLETPGSSPISLLGAKKEGAESGKGPSEPPTRSIDDIFARMDQESATEETPGPPSRPSTTESHDRHRIYSLLQDLGNHVEPTKEEVVKFIDEPEHAVSKEDEIELIAESSQPTNKPQIGRQSPVKRRGRISPPTRRFDPHKPAIITLDSLGHPHGATTRALKQYLVAEAEDKRGGMEVDHKEIQGVTGVGIPNQDNFSDCGLYLLGYVEKFATNPKWLVTNLLQKTLDPEKNWPELNANAMRASLRELLCQQYTDHREEMKETKKLKKAQNAAFDAHRPAPTALGDGTAEPARQTQGQQDGTLPTSWSASASPLGLEHSDMAASTSEDIPSGDYQNAVRGTLAEEPMNLLSNNQDTDTGEADLYHVLDDSPSDSQQIEVQIPRFSELEDARTIPETPEPSPSPEPVSIASSRLSRHWRPPTPPRPKSRGKNAARASRAVGAISKEPIILDDD